MKKNIEMKNFSQESDDQKTLKMLRVFIEEVNKKLEDGRKAYGNALLMPKTDDGILEHLDKEIKNRKLAKKEMEDEVLKLENKIAKSKKGGRRTRKKRGKRTRRRKRKSRKHKSRKRKTRKKRRRKRRR
tara:strand:+ start:334 stop:720 length:387 start_codon:yes stop_codon:yes gene_type:complete